MDVEVRYRDYEHLLQLALRENQLTLFSLHGEDLGLDHERHVAGHLGEDFVWRSEAERIEYSLQLAIDVWASWEIHLRKSSYSLPYFGSVHLEDAWLDGSGESPPCIVMRNVKLKQPVEVPARPPVNVAWSSERVLGPLETYTYREAGSGRRMWRFYLARGVAAE